MASNTQPHNPQEWLIYASNKDILQIPLRRSIEQSNADSRFRDIYLDVATIDNLSNQNSKTDVSIFADALGFSSPSITVPVHGSEGVSRGIQLYARVITADQPIHLELQAEKSDSPLVRLFSSIVDQPVSCSFNGGEKTLLELGSKSNNVGVDIEQEEGKPKLKYYKSYGDLEDEHDVGVSDLIKTQLRVATSLFWTNPSMALAIASHVTRTTSETKSRRILYAQAVSLGQQIASAKLAGPRSNYAPTLKIESYQETLESAIETAGAFQKSYDRYTDKTSTKKDQIEALKGLLTSNENHLEVKRQATHNALGKYTDARNIVSDCTVQTGNDQVTIKKLQKDFRDGIEEWKKEKEKEAIVTILTSIITFAVAIGAMCMGDEAAGTGAANAPAEAEKAIEAVKEAESIVTKLKKILQSDTMKKLKACAEKMGEIYESVENIVKAIDEIVNKPTVKVPELDVDIDSIVSIGAWDNWVLQTDDQMQFAIDQDINGAHEYRLALRSHATNGKMLAQAQAATAKAGQEYIQAKLAVTVSEEDSKSLQKLLSDADQEEAHYEDAKALLYDQVMMVRMSVVTEMRNLIWAYKFYTLEDSQVSLELWKPIEQYQLDVLTIKQELQNAEAQFAGDYQPFHFKVHVKDLPAQFTSLLHSLQSPPYTAIFTLAPFIVAPIPSNDTNAQSSTVLEAFAGPFTKGSHFRVDGLEATLIGAVPKSSALSDGLAVTAISITTSGIYSDVKEDHVFHFNSKPLTRRFEYYVTEKGERGEVRIKSSFKTTTHVQPTPFTRWTIRLEDADQFDLSGLTDVLLEWTGSAYFK